MVVDDVENHGQSQSVGVVDEGTKVIGRAVQAGGGEKIDSIVPPTKASAEIMNRHDLQDCHTQFL